MDEGRCVHNDNINCGEKKCQGCGWNPRVYYERRGLLREQARKGELPHVTVKKQP